MNLRVQVLMIARTLGVLNLGNIALDGSKLKANASRHSALSYGHIKKLEEQLKGEVKKLMELAGAADNEKIPDDMNLPEEIARREDRIKAIAEAKTKIEGRAKERFEQEQIEYQDKLGKREAKSKESGKPPRGKSPVPPVEGAQDKDQINLTDEGSRIMKVAGSLLGEPLKGADKTVSRPRRLNFQFHLVVTFILCLLITDIRSDHCFI